MTDLLGIIVTGVPRSGTTLALALRAPLAEDDMFTANEPDAIHPHIGHWRMREAEAVTREVIARLGAVKLPELAFVLPHFEPVYDVTLTFRDFRLFLPSVMEHRNASSVTGTHSCWRRYVGGPEITIEQVEKMDYFERALRYFKTAYMSASYYLGPIRVWSYGFWDEWEGKPSWTKNSPVVNGMSTRMARDIWGESRLSDASFDLGVWEKFKAERGLDDSHEARIDELHDQLKHLYDARGLILKTLDDK